ncbi:MAG: ADP-glyceromanno-heptose 6-epimerase [Lentimicrobiaceae bacterium]|nr:ADP-glyceromanno-heptose 6-epimerase [Lentimicrobiaceae bacterium]
MKQVIVTGVAGFIGSCLVRKLWESGYEHIVGVDDFSVEEKSKNTLAKSYLEKIDRKNFFSWLDIHAENVDFVLHIGARTDTTETNWELLNELNLTYSQQVWEKCALHQIPLIYASSAATYGLGEQGYKDSHSLVEQLKPLNLYGISKNEFDKWALKQEEKPPFWAGLKFFNVYGPNEYHKKRMASVIFHAYNQIQENGKVKLFRSHRPDFKDGEQLRDFIYVKDVVNVIIFLMKQQPQSGIYNLGTGKARSFLDLAKATFQAVNKAENIDFVDTPIDIRDKYQYFTQADMEKLTRAGYTTPFTSLEEGVSDYVVNYLSKNINY